MTSLAEVRAHVARREATLARVRLLLIERLRVKRTPGDIDPDTPLFGSGLGLDSVDAVELLVLLDTEFRVRLPNDVMGRAEIRTVNSLVDLVIAHEDASHAAE